MITGANAGNSDVIGRPRRSILTFANQDGVPDSAGAVSRRRWLICGFECRVSGRQGEFRRDAVRIEVRGNAMAVYLDGRKNLRVEDDTFAEGRVALYAWGCVGAKYRGLILRHAPPEKAR